MYRQIWVDPKRTPFQRILFRNKEGELIDFELKTVTFGVNCAPFLALRLLQQLADDVEKDFPKASNIVRHFMYVDDVLAGANSIQGAQLAISEIHHAFPKYCANCLANQNSERVCRNGDTCKKCGQDHHTLLHLLEFSSSRRRSISPLRPLATLPRPSASGLRSPNPMPSSRNHSRCSDQFEAPTAAPSVASLLQHRSVQIIPTANVVLNTETNKYESRIWIISQAL